MPAPRKKRATPEKVNKPKPSETPQRMPKTAPELEIMLYEDRRPWEWHPWETSLSYHAFCVYLRLGPTRSLVRTQFELMPDEEKRRLLLENGITEGTELPENLPDKTVSTTPDQEAIDADAAMMAALTDQLAPVEPEPAAPTKKKPGPKLKAIRNLPVPVTASGLAAWSTKYMWGQRVAYWDAHLEELDRQRLIDERADLSRRAKESGRALSNVAMHFLKLYTDGSEETPKIKPPSWDQLVKLVEAGNKLEKSGLGLDDETAAKIKLEMTTTLNTESLSDEELDQLIELQSKVQTKGGSQLMLPPPAKAYAPPAKRTVQQTITVTTTADRPAPVASPDSLSNFFGLG